MHNPLLRYLIGTTVTTPYLSNTDTLSYPHMILRYINQVLHCIGFYSRVFVLFLFWRGRYEVTVKFATKNMLYLLRNPVLYPDILTQVYNTYIIYIYI